MNIRFSFQISLAIAVAIIVAVIVVTNSFNKDQTTETISQNTVESFQVITVGPVWESDTWSCTSDTDFLVHGALRGLEGSMLSIAISGLGSQSLYSLDPTKMESFTVGAPGGRFMNITRTGAVTGWLTLETQSGAAANCFQQ